MSDSKTVRDDLITPDPVYLKQQQDVASMRASLLNCTLNDASTSRIALQRITVMRVYHQMSRIIKYTELMDKIEAKLYESIENSLDNMDTTRPSTWMQLLSIQEKLQKSMIESHKLLQPYLEFESLNNYIVDASQPQIVGESFATMMLDQDSRDKLRTSAQAVLAALNVGPTSTLNPGGGNE